MAEPDDSLEVLASQPSELEQTLPAPPLATQAVREPTGEGGSRRGKRKPRTTKVGEADSPKSAKGGRPTIEFDLAVVEGLGRIGATAGEMVHVLPASRSTIEHRMAEKESDFHRAYHKGRSLLFMSLRRKQIEVAMAGNVRMLVWLGKQHLGQCERSLLTGLDLNACTDEQIERLASGEDPLTVLGLRS